MLAGSSSSSSTHTGSDGGSSMLAGPGGSSLELLTVTSEVSAALTSDSDNESIGRSLLAASTPKRSKIASYVRDLHVSLYVSVNFYTHIVISWYYISENEILLPKYTYMIYYIS